MKIIRNFKTWVKDDSKGDYSDLINPFDFGLQENAFIDYKTKALFSKILNRCYIQSLNFDNEQARNSLFDNYDQTKQVCGLISLLADAMTDKNKIYLVYEKVGLVRLATEDETKQIQDDYEKKAESDVGVIANFKNFVLSDLVKMYMALLFNILKSANTQVHLSRALQIKVNELRKLFSNNTSENAITQAREIIENLKNGNSILIDAGDTVSQTEISITAVKESLDFVYTQLAGELGVSYSFVSGILTSGMAVTGEADTQAEERGIESFFISIFKPICDKLYKLDLAFKTDNWRELKANIEMLPYIDTLTLLSNEQKDAIVKMIFENIGIKTNE